MSEIKGIDQIFPKKSAEESAKSNARLWITAGVVAALAAGFALMPSSPEPKPTVSVPVVSAPAPTPASVPVTPAPEKVAAPKKPVVEDVRLARKEAKRQQQRPEVAQADVKPAPEVKAAAKALSGGRGCDCETAEVNLPAQCPDASCRQCKATCGIPGN